MMSVLLHRTLSVRAQSASLLRSLHDLPTKASVRLVVVLLVIADSGHRLPRFVRSSDLKQFLDESLVENVLLVAT